jgi:hypothetical protein
MRGIAIARLTRPKTGESAASIGTTRVCCSAFLLRLDQSVHISRIERCIGSSGSGEFWVFFRLVTRKKRKRKNNCLETIGDHQRCIAHCLFVLQSNRATESVILYYYNGPPATHRHSILGPPVSVSFVAQQACCLLHYTNRQPTTTLY